MILRIHGSSNFGQKLPLAAIVSASFAAHPTHSNGK
jgi:hypothetical protein